MESFYTQFRHSPSHYRQPNCLFSNLFKQTSKQQTNINTLHYCPLGEESAGDWWFPSQKATNADSASMSWRYRELFACYLLLYINVQRKIVGRVCHYSFSFCFIYIGTSGSVSWIRITYICTWCIVYDVLKTANSLAPVIDGDSPCLTI